MAVKQLLNHGNVNITLRTKLSLTRLLQILPFKLHIGRLEAHMTSSQWMLLANRSSPYRDLSSWITSFSLRDLSLDGLCNNKTLVLIEYFALFWSFLTIFSSLLFGRRLASLLRQSVGMRVTVSVLALRRWILVAEQWILACSIGASHSSWNGTLFYVLAMRRYSLGFLIVTFCVEDNTFNLDWLHLFNRKLEIVQRIRHVRNTCILAHDNLAHFMRCISHYQDLMTAWILAWTWWKRANRLLTLSKGNPMNLTIGLVFSRFLVHLFKTHLVIKYILWVTLLRSRLRFIIRLRVAFFIRTNLETCDWINWTHLLTSFLIVFQILITPRNRSASALKIWIKLITSILFIAIPDALINLIVFVEPIRVIARAPFRLFSIGLVHLNF